VTDLIRAWFNSLAMCVAEVDYDAAARDLFAPEIVAFGTRAHLVAGLADVQEHQWSQVWPNVRDFRFDLDSLRHGVSGNLIWAAALWSSTGFAADGQPVDRPGRATVVFRNEGGRLLAVHTHFSLAPR
jgi:ketosteroid isomerase-like protein